MSSPLLCAYPILKISTRAFGAFLRISFSNSSQESVYSRLLILTLTDTVCLLSG